MIAPEKLKVLVEKFQCPGCQTGSDTECGAYKPGNFGDHGGACVSHIAGTHIQGRGLIYLGLPKGFQRCGDNDGVFKGYFAPLRFPILLFAGAKPYSDPKYCLTIWALEEEEYLFVRTFEPRLNRSRVEIYEGGKLADVPAALNVAEFRDEFDP